MRDQGQRATPDTMTNKVIVNVAVARRQGLGAGFGCRMLPGEGRGLGGEIGESPGAEVGEDGVLAFGPSVVQGAGAALRMSAAAFRRHCRENAALRQAMNLYIQVRMNQLAQTAACTHRHDVESRVARWMLMTRDRALSNRFHLTHEFLADMLGVRRVGITQAASSLQERGLISYRRGEIVILNGADLGKASCLCYGRGKAMYAQTMGVHAAAAQRYVGGATEPA